jgi:hypothetical protein
VSRTHAWRLGVNPRNDVLLFVSRHLGNTCSPRSESIRGDLPQNDALALEEYYRDMVDSTVCIRYSRARAIRLFPIRAQETRVSLRYKGALGREHPGT